MKAEYYGYIAGALSILAYLPYLIQIFYDRRLPNTDEKKCRPKRASWVIWFTTSAIIFATMEANASTFAKYQALAYAIGATITLLVAIPYGEGGWTRSDKCYLGIALFGLILWWYFKSAWYAFAFAMCVDAIGVLPVIHARGRGEDWKAWTLWSAGTFANLGGMTMIADTSFRSDNPALSDMVYPIAMSIVVFTGTAFVWRWKIKHWRYK